MIEEDVIIKTSRYSNEDTLIINVVSMITLTGVFFGGDCEFIKIFFALLGVAAAVNLIRYRQNWLDSNKYTIPAYFGLLIPSFVALFICVYGLFNCVIIDNKLEFTSFLTLDSTISSTIISASDSPLNVIITQLVSISAFATALSIVFITQSRYIVRRILFLATLVAGVLALIGFTFEGLYSAGIVLRYSFSSFYLFSSSSQWSAFAILWLGAGLCVANYTLQRYTIFEFVFSQKFYSIALSILLLSSVLYVGTAIECFIALSITFLGFGFLFLDSIPTESNLQRHWTYKKVSSKTRFLRTLIPSILYLCVSIISIVYAINLLPNIISSPQESAIVMYDNTDFVGLENRQIIKTETIDLIEQRRNFGWGTASFKDLFAFQQGADLGDKLFTSPYSDLLQKLLENGIVGLCLISIAPIILFFRWIFRFDFSRSGFILLPTFSSILLLSVLTNPFECIAVVLSFWVIMMSMFTWDSSTIR